MAKKQAKQVNPIISGLVDLNMNQLNQLIKEAKEYHDELKIKKNEKLIGSFPDSKVFTDFVKKVKLLEAKMENLPEEKVTFTVTVSKNRRNSSYGVANVLLENCYPDEVLESSIDVVSVTGNGLNKKNLNRILEETQEFFDNMCDEGSKLLFPNSLKQRQNIEGEINSLVSWFKEKLIELDLDPSELGPELIKAGLL